jgi:hypothetical protein
LGAGGAVSARIESSYIINLRDLDMKHVKDFIFVHGECYQAIRFMFCLMGNFSQQLSLFFFSLSKPCCIEGVHLLIFNTKEHIGNANSEFLVVNLKLLCTYMI